MKISKYTIARRNTKATIKDNYYECEYTNDNAKALKRCLMPFRVTEDNKIIFPYFN